MSQVSNADSAKPNSIVELNQENGPYPPAGICAKAVFELRSYVHPLPSDLRNIDCHLGEDFKPLLLYRSDVAKLGEDNSPCGRQNLLGV
ncbi:hypothetical protein FOC84_21250 [Achromobacter pestifer]|uniref:Uncharacterized protein n=1 Tax=Achromobacter pestifer TaxID=1353889 RepID=A0A7D4IK23_9BURK|nr:hypothetical protein [Achromobacter pestifer]QKH37323.1 hypothetical protein FOC84_21250 [Achromobacter pestifer]